MLETPVVACGDKLKYGTSVDPELGWFGSIGFVGKRIDFV